MIFIGSITAETRRFLDNLMVEYLFKPLEDWMPTERVCFLIFFLKQLPDSKDGYFPRGKWATIQYLEHLVEDQLKILIQEAEDEY